MAKRRDSSMSKELKIAIFAGAVLAIFLFGGQLTGGAVITLSSVDMDITISSDLSCVFDAAGPTAIAVTGAVAATTYSSTATVRNDGNVADLVFKVTANETVNSAAFSAGGTNVTLDGIDGVGTSSGSADITSLTTTQTVWCTDVDSGEDCDFRFSVLNSAAEPAGTYEFTYTVTCVG